MRDAHAHWSEIMEGHRLVKHGLHVPILVEGLIPPKYEEFEVPHVPSPSPMPRRSYEHGSMCRNDPRHQAITSTAPLKKERVATFFRSLFSTCWEARAYIHEAR
jgi:hypothetical protein